MAIGDVEVQPSDGQWAVKIDGDPITHSVHRSKEDAVNDGRALAKELRVELIVQER